MGPVKDFRNAPASLNLQNTLSAKPLAHREGTSASSVRFMKEFAASGSVLPECVSETVPWTRLPCHRASAA